jgi:hypothetical protein
MPSAIAGWFGVIGVVDDEIFVPDVWGESEAIVAFARFVAFGVGVLGVA